MSHLVAVAEQIHRALDRCTSARQAMKVATELLEEALDLLTTHLAGSRDQGVEMMLADLSTTRDALDDLLGLAVRAEESVRAYLDGLIGVWRGQTADEHAQNGGRAVGRTPPGRKKYPVREVRSVAELDELFAALSQGARVLEKPGYHGLFMEFANGTTIGYRTKSRSSPDPTVDIKRADGTSVKIHVNRAEWT